MPNTAIFVAASLGIVVLLPALAIAGAGSPESSCAAIQTPSLTVSATPSPMPNWDAAQRAVAGTILAVGSAKAIPVQGQVVALATAMQESGLRNLPGGDADSIGVFQQRPSQGWGTRTQLRSVEYQAGKFYAALLAVPGWQSMTLDQAAQAVQRSAFPEAYGRWTLAALTLMQQLSEPGGTGPNEQFAGTTACSTSGATTDGTTSATASAAIEPAGPRAAGAVAWALAQLGTPYSYGGDCTAPHSGLAARRCDCSSLVQQAYRTVGIHLPRTTTTQVHEGTAVPSADRLQPGDLIFIPGSHGTRQAPDHVGMYIGGGLLVHAPATGEVVRIARLQSWRPQIVALRRIAR